MSNYSDETVFSPRDHVCFVSNVIKNVAPPGHGYSMRYALTLLAGLVVAPVFLFFFSDNVIVDCAGWDPGLPLGGMKMVSCDRPASPQIQAECVKRGGFMDGSNCLPKNAEVEKCVARHHTWSESLQTCQPRLEPAGDGDTVTAVVIRDAPV